eukprot:97747-Prorocentrum_minimum.AAC.1
MCYASWLRGPRALHMCHTCPAAAAAAASLLLLSLPHTLGAPGGNRLRGRCQHLIWANQTQEAQVYSHNGPIRHRKWRYIRTTDQSDTLSAGIFSRRTNQTQEVPLAGVGTGTTTRCTKRSKIPFLVCSHDGPIRHIECSIFSRRAATWQFLQTSARRAALSPLCSADKGVNVDNKGVNVDDKGVNVDDKGVNVDDKG